MSTDKRVTIMTLNLRFGLARDGENAWEKRQDRVAGILEQYPADFIGFQEVNHFQAGFLAGHLPDHNHIGWYNKKTPWWQSNMIFYHNSWTCLGSRHHFLTPTPDIPSKLEGSKWPRQCVVGWFQKKGKDLVMANTHFDFYPRVQDKSAQLVLEFLSRFPLGLSSVITGDFNADPGSLAYERFMAHGFDEVLKGEKMTTFHGFSGKETFRHIDWILYQGGLILDGVRVVTDDFKGKFPSDHYPVISTFSWKDSPHLP